MDGGTNMETQTERVEQNDARAGEGLPTETQPEAAVREGTESVAQEEVPNGALTPEQLEQLPPELRPGPNGEPPQITEKTLRSLRAKYFTVKHPLLADCGHKLDMINQPRNNCENCWFQWFNTHPQLVETADQFFRTHGKGAMVGMRGEKFTKMFLRFMATVIHFMKQEGRLPHDSNQSGGSPEASGEREGRGVEAVDQ